jgi:hypothetical protein
MAAKFMDAWVRNNYEYASWQNDREKNAVMAIEKERDRIMDALEGVS